MRQQLSATLFALLVLSSPVHAHDYWLEPDTFFPAAGTKINVRLHVGEHFTSETEKPFERKPTLKFQVLTMDGRETQDLNALGKEGKKPVASLKLAAPGSYLFRMERAPRTIRLEADKFNKYLAEEGLESVLKQREQASESKKEGRERYSRYLKSLVQVGDTPTNAFQHVLGHKVEILPEANPAARKPGETLTVLVLLEGEPLAGAAVFAHHRGKDKVTTQRVKTTESGKATFKLDQPGPWLIRLVHMRRCEETREADWESFWAAYSFGVK